MKKDKARSLILYLTAVNFLLILINVGIEFLDVFTSTVTDTILISLQSIVAMAILIVFGRNKHYFINSKSEK